MKYEKSLFLSVFVILLSGITACNELEDVSRTVTGVTVKLPDDLSGASIANDTLTFQNISSGLSVKVPATEKPELPQGLYNCFYKADVTYVDEGRTVKGRLRGALENVNLTSGNVSLTMNTHLLIDKDDFIIEEIFFTGTLRESGKQYYGDSYVKIYNNTDHVLYADGLALVESKFVSTQKYDYTPDIRQDTMTVHAIYVVPGSGEEHPVQPGESMVICDTGINHQVANPNSFDLSEANFVWYDVSTSPDNMDIDSETVENLDKWYCYTLSVFVLHNRGFRSYALARMQVPKEEYLKKFFYKYEYIISSPQGNYPWSQKAYKLPNDWIVDGVNCSVEAERQWNVLPATVDAGWTHCGKIDHDKDRYFKSVRRKMLYLDENGHRVLQDTDNSTDDFNTECIPSLIEEQNTAISADGRKAETLTYDGVQPVEE